MSGFPPPVASTRISETSQRLPTAPLTAAKKQFLPTKQATSFEPRGFSMGRAKPYSPLDSLDSRRDNNDPSVTYVAMYGYGRESQSVHIPAGQAHTVYTSGLSGCDSVAVIARQANGDTLVHMNHFPDIVRDFQKQDLSSISRNFKNFNEAGSKYRILIAQSGEWAKSPEGTWKMVPRDKNKSISLEQSAKESISDKSAVKTDVLAYDLNQSPEKHGGFILNIPAKPEEPIRYDLNASEYGSIKF